MAVSDLTNTTWVINSTTCTAGYGVFNVEAQTSIEGDQWNTLYIGYAFGQGETYTQANSIVWLPFVAYPSGEFTITGGDDVTDPDLIAWFEANATQQVEPTQSDYLEIYSNDERATHYKIYANGILIATIARVNVVQEGSELTVLSAPATQSGSEVTLG